MPPVVSIADSLYTWTLTFADGSTRTVLGSSMQTVIGGIFPSPVTSAVRGPAFDINTDGPPPTVASLNPATAKIGDPSFTLHVIGTGFKPGVIIVFAGMDEPTTFVSPTEVTTLVDMSYWHGPDALPVSVRSLAGVESNAVTFAMTA
jgi:hypothetical protein